MLLTTTTLVTHPPTAQVQAHLLLSDSDSGPPGTPRCADAHSPVYFSFIERMIIDPLSIERIDNHPFDTQGRPHAPAPSPTRPSVDPPYPACGIESIPEPTLPIESGLTNTLACVGIEKEGTPTGTLTQATRIR